MSISDRLIETARLYDREATKCRRARAYLPACIMQVSVLETELLAMALAVSSGAATRFRMFNDSVFRAYDRLIGSVVSK